MTIEVSAPPFVTECDICGTLQPCDYDDDEVLFCVDRIACQARCQEALDGATSKTMDDAVRRAHAMRHVPLPNEEGLGHHTPEAMEPVILECATCDSCGHIGRVVETDSKTFVCVNRRRCQARLTRDTTPIADYSPPPCPTCGGEGGCPDCDPAQAAALADLASSEFNAQAQRPIRGHMTCECALCCRIQRCFHNGETWICYDRQACEARTEAAPEPPVDGGCLAECANCGTVQLCHNDGEALTCIDRAVCNGRMVASVKVLSGYCGGCYGRHHTWQCPQIGALLMAPPAPRERHTPMSPIEALRLAVTHGVFGIDTLALLRAALEAANKQTSTPTSIEACEAVDNIAGWFLSFYNDVMATVPEYAELCGDLNALTYLVSEAQREREKARAVLEAANQDAVVSAEQRTHDREFAQGVWRRCQEGEAIEVPAMAWSF